MGKLKNQISIQNISIKEEKDKLAALILKHKEVIKVKDAIIKYFQPKPIESNITSFNFRGKIHLVQKESNVSKSKDTKETSTQSMRILTAR